MMIRKYNPDVIMVNEVLPKNFSRLIHLEEFAIQGYDMVPMTILYETREGAL